MSNLPTTAVKLPPATALDVSSMPPSEIARHRAEIVVSVEIVMDGYWRDDMPEAKRAVILADWCDELEPWPIDSIRAALRKHRRDRPDKRPNPGHILAILAEAWGKRNAPLTRAALTLPEPAPQPRVSPDRAAEICAAAGFTPRRIQPSASEREQGVA